MILRHIPYLFLILLAIIAIIFLTLNLCCESQGSDVVIPGDSDQAVLKKLKKKIAKEKINKLLNQKKFGLTTIICSLILIIAVTVLSIM